MARVDFVKKDTFMGTSYVGNLANKLLPLCFFAYKVAGNIHQIYCISFKKSILKVARFVKIQTIRQLSYEFWTCFTQLS